MPTRRHFILASAATAISGPRAIAAEYPERPVTVVIPYAAGGAGDASSASYRRSSNAISASCW
jgi:tripartite-type tricarboxylate transporter receptor subunit TctC